jgi:hypothetical protein
MSAKPLIAEPAEAGNDLTVSGHPDLPTAHRK